MKITHLHIWQRTVHFREPMLTSYGRLDKRLIHFVEVQLASGARGVGEIEALPDPGYVAETQATAVQICQKFCFPLLIQQEVSHPREISQLLAPIQGNQMAKAAIEMACWDAFAHEQEKPLAQLLGGSVTQKVAVGATFGIEKDLGRLKAKVEQATLQGIQRIKLKIQPEWDTEPLTAIRQAFPEITLVADANGAYQEAPFSALERLDACGLAFLEQPLAALDILGHAYLQRQLKTPLCLDEAIMSLEDAQLIAHVEAAKVINLKVARVGGFQPALEILGFCQRVGIKVWLGGMYETEIGRAGALALATRAGFSFPHDLNPSQQYYDEATAQPRLKVMNGQILLSELPGLGFERIEKHDH